MGACGCLKSVTAEEEYFDLFWNSLQIKDISAEQLIEKISNLKSNSKDQFLKDFEKIIIEVFFKTEELKKISDYLIENSLSIVSPFKAFTVFFSLLLVCDCKSKRSFAEAFKQFFVLLSKFADVLAFDINDKQLIKEYTIFYVYLVSMQTHKAFLGCCSDLPIFERSRNEYCLIYSQRNRDEFVENLFVYYQKNEFNLYSFMLENLNKLQHSKVRLSLQEIEKKKFGASHGQ